MFARAGPRFLCLRSPRDAGVGVWGCRASNYNRPRANIDRWPPSRSIRSWRTRQNCCRNCLYLSEHAANRAAPFSNQVKTLAHDRGWLVASVAHHLRIILISLARADSHAAALLLRHHGNGSVPSTPHPFLLLLRVLRGLLGRLPVRWPCARCRAPCEYTRTEFY